MKAVRDKETSRSGTEHLKDKMGRKEKGKKSLSDAGSPATATVEDEEEEVPEEDFEIDPCDDIFSLTSPRCLTVSENVSRMATLYGFFIPDREYCADLEGMIGYLHEKVKLGHYCLHCQRVFTTATGTIQHMRDSGHTKLRYEEGVDLEEFDVFYDFEEANEEYLDGELPDTEEEDEEGLMGDYEDNIKKAGFRINEIGEREVGGREGRGWGS